MNMAGVYNPPQEKSEMVQVIQTAFDNGVDFLTLPKFMDPSTVKKSLLRRLRHSEIK